MLTDKVCEEFESIWKFFSDDLNESGNYNFTSGMLKKYCPKGNCDSDINKIDAGCLWLFSKFYEDSDKFSRNANENINIVVYFMMWLGYKLNKIPQDGIIKFDDFYSKHMQNVEEYKKPIDDVSEYKSYIDLIIKKKELMDISNENMSKLYDLFKNLCKMYNDISKISNNKKKYIEYANKFADEYKKLFNDNDNNVEGNSYNQILSTLSNDYVNFRNNYVNPNIQNTIPELITEKTPQVSVSNPKEAQMHELPSEISESRSETDVSSLKDKVSDSDSGSPSSSILNKLISIPLIFIATLILLGIAYKCNNFDTLWKLFPDDLNASGNYNFPSGLFKKYCSSEKCEGDANIVNAGCLWLFNEFFSKTGTTSYHDVYKDVVVCIMIWLSYRLNQKPENGIKTLNDFYSDHIENNNEYTKDKLNDPKYNSYKEIIDEIKEYMNIDIIHISKFYKLLKLLCDMNTSYKNNNSNKISEDGKKFVDEYGRLFNDIDNNIDNSSFSKVLLVLSNCYTNFGKGTYFNNMSINLTPLPTKKTPQKDNVESSKETKTTESLNETGKPDIATITLSPNNALSDSSLVSKLIPVLSIFGVIAIFLGISYKVNNKELKNITFKYYFH
ncbi:hypothetical protein YYC_03530 [Plasmodium yoelii 17X]|uniref:Uncharacterized protein n=1 Tax=Plasmodium yoelii 17X TaxID=1323249 RepID=V7PGZ2_PLAYE|nr:hypothetical protein YYC_03530 [Plasmodium yoelii 17X]